LKNNNFKACKIFFLVTLLLFGFSNQAMSIEKKSVLFNLENILGTFPQRYSEGEREDLLELLYLQATRTKDQCENARLEEEVSVETFFGGENGPLSPKETRRLKIFSFFKKICVGIPAAIAKGIFERPRPYLTFSEIKPCIEKEDSYSYPSGHAAIARAMAHILAKKFPERAALFYERADEVALNRVLGGVHYPSDIVAGKKLADALSKEVLSDKRLLMEIQNL
jgi:acid phosphatase (class A)